MSKIFPHLVALALLTLCSCPGKTKNTPPPSEATTNEITASTATETPATVQPALGQKSEVSFHRDVLPLLKELAGDCHTADNMAGEYAIDSYEAVMSGGTDPLPNVIPGKPESSLLYIYLEKGHPFNKKPDSASLNIIRTWILQGAKNN